MDLLQGKELKKHFWLEWALRIGMAGVFLSNSIQAFQGSEEFAGYITAITGAQAPTVSTFLLLIGILDATVALAVLIKPWRPVLVWGTFWAILTTVIGLIVNGPAIADALERLVIICVPLSLLLLRGFPATFAEWFK